MKLTDSAISQIQMLLNSEATAVALRVGIIGGGCSGFNYTFSFADNIEEEDAVFKQDGINVIVDPMSLMYLEGSSIDYTTSIAGNQFVVDNPQASTTCGCGTSFSV